MYYVYELIDPRDGKVFYIGKGKGERAWQHEIEARSGVFGNNWQKYCTIKSIIGANLCVEIRIVKEFDIESEAYYLEKQLIASTKGLTNIAEGGEIMRYMFKLPKKEETKHRREIEKWVKKAPKIADQIEVERQAEKTENRLPRWVRRATVVRFVEGPFEKRLGRIVKVRQDSLIDIEIDDMDGKAVASVPLDSIARVR